MSTPAVEAGLLLPPKMEEWVLDEMRPHKVWTRFEVYDALKSGLLQEDGSWELLEGDIVKKVGKNRPHIRCTNAALRWLARAFGLEHVQVQDPMTASNTSEPEPDLCVFRKPVDDYTEPGSATADEVLIVVEVSDSMFVYGSKRKMRIYARAGVADYWIVDIERRRIVVYRDPQPMDDKYANVNEYGENESIAPLAAPESSVLVRELLP